MVKPHQCKNRVEVLTKTDDKMRSEIAPFKLADFT